MNTIGNFKIACFNNVTGSLRGPVEYTDLAEAIAKAEEIIERYDADSLTGWVKVVEIVGKFNAPGRFNTVYEIVTAR